MSKNIKKIYIGKALLNESPDILRIAKCYEDHGKIKLVDKYEDADVIWKSIFRGLDNIANGKKHYTINSFPKIGLLTNKENLYKSIIKYIPKKDIYTVIPKTWMINENNFNEIKKDIIHHLGNNPLVITKPTYLFGGIGITVLRLNDLSKPKTSILIQEYIWKVKTIKHLTEDFQVKFDIRVNLVIDNKGNIYLYKPFLARVSDIEYILDGKLDQLAHITNTSLRDHLTENAERNLQDDPELKKYEIPIIKFIKNTLIKLIYSVVYKEYENLSCFQRIGIDLIILDNGDVKLLEMNENPGNQKSSSEDALILQLIPFWFSDLGIKPNAKQKKHFKLIAKYKHFKQPIEFTDSRRSRPGSRALSHK